MKRLNSFFLSLLLLFASQVKATDNSPIHFQEITSEVEWQTILSQSQKQNQVIFVMVHTAWCGYCRKMEQDIYTKSKVATYHNDTFINIRIDGESPFGMKFSEKHRVEAFPGLLFLNGGESVLQNITGYLNAKDLLYYGEESVRINTVMANWESAYRQGTLSPDQLMTYANLLLEKGEETSAQEVATAYFQQVNSPDFNDNRQLQFAIQFDTQLNSKVYQTVVAQKEQLSPQAINEYFDAVCDYTIQQAIENKDISLINTLIKEVLPITLGDASQADYATHAMMMKTVYHAALEDWSSYSTLITNYHEQYQATAGNDFLYEQANYVIRNYQSPKALTAAISWLDQAINTQGERFSFRMLQAHAYGIKGNKKQAVQLANQALNLANDRKERRMAEELKSRFE